MQKQWFSKPNTENKAYIVDMLSFACHNYADSYAITLLGLGKHEPTTKGRLQCRDVLQRL